ncbi:MAG: hypothetical protein K6E84_02335 [Lachnospiraceae bacterium]|nr:hypothetical protein [Lachnospiraceae bacterium]
MLKKLLVHEWKDTWKLMTILNAAMLVVALIGVMVFNHDNLDKVMSAEKYQFGTMMGFMSYMMVYVVGIGVLAVVSTLFFFIRFYRNLYTDQGYLMHTLPVTSNDLMLSKTLVAFVWKCISSFVVTFSVAILIASMMEGGVSELFRSIGEGLRELEISNGKAILFILVFILLGIGSMLFSIMKGYAAISIGQQISKNKVLASIGIYIGISMAIQLVTNLLTQSLIFGMGAGIDKGLFANWEPTENTLLVIYLVAALLTLAASAGLYILSLNFMKNKLNLD